MNTGYKININYRKYYTTARDTYSSNEKIVTDVNNTQTSFVCKTVIFYYY